MQQATLIGYSSAEVHKQMKPVNYKDTRSPSHSFTKQTQEQFFPRLSLTLFLGTELVLTYFLENYETKNLTQNPLFL